MQHVAVMQYSEGAVREVEKLEATTSKPKFNNTYKASKLKYQNSDSLSSVLPPSHIAISPANPVLITSRYYGADPGRTLDLMAHLFWGGS